MTAKEQAEQIYRIKRKKIKQEVIKKWQIK